MSRAWRAGLMGQFITFVLIALLLAQGLSYLISWNEHAKVLNDVAKSEFFSRARSMTGLMDSLPAEHREQVLLASETGNSRFWLTPMAMDDAPEWRHEAASQFARPLDNFIDLSQYFSGTPSQVSSIDPARVDASNAGEDWGTPLGNLWQLPQAARYVYFDGQRGYGLQIGLSDGSVLNAAFYLTDSGGWWTSTSLVSLGLTALVLASIAVFGANRIAGPLRDLARSAEAFGRGENVAPLPEEGPNEVRRTAEAFNRMQERLSRFIADRTRMLAAIGHDLRTPLTSLRLRIEFLDDRDMRERMLASIGEMEAMTEAAIGFARGESTAEVTRAVDLQALVASVCDDLADIGQNVRHGGDDRIIYRCRPAGLQRAVRNLVENAVRYGEEASVNVRLGERTLDITVEDRGPGIPEDMRESVFAPFFRLEYSRNRATGGIGLGLSIARAIARQHGGDITFAMAGHGMVTTLSLPREALAAEKGDARPIKVVADA
jgi:signal transduction histidine kinase